MLGDRKVGKTCLLSMFTTGKFPDDYLTISWHNLAHTCTFEGQDYLLDLWDPQATLNTDIDKSKRPSYLQNTHVLLLLFSAIDPDSFINITKEYLPLIRDHKPRVPFILVCTKTDLRNDSEEIEALQKRHQRLPFDQGEGMKLAESIGASSYMEISAMHSEGVRELFQEVVRIGNEQPSDKSNSKCVLS